jgi:hypothetical protein
MSLLLQLSGGSRGVVYVEQQLHRAKRSCCRRQCASAASAAA